MTKEVKKREIRTTPCTIQVRENEPGEDGKVEESRTIVGTAIVFNRESEVLDPDWDPFREVIKPEAATAAFLRTQDIKLNLLHERNSTIGRSNKGVGNLKIEVTPQGVNFEIDVPKCDLGDRALELTKAGVYSGCSFEFYPKDYTIEEVTAQDGTKYTRVTHTAFESISAFTIAMDPAYSQTEVHARELADKTPQAQERREKAEKHRQRELEIAKAQDFLRRQEIENITFNL